MTTANVTEGEVQFLIPGISKPCHTWYKTLGSDSSGPTVRPLIILHGGPGLSHDYMLPLSSLNTQHGIPVIFYDQIGNGKSTHLPEKKGDESFWTEKLFHDELENLIEKLGLSHGDGYDLLGHSWGGMMGATFAGDRPKGLRKLVLSNTPATVQGWVEAYASYREDLTLEVREVLTKHEKDGTMDSEEYEGALMLFFKKHACSVQPFPTDLMTSFVWSKTDDTVAMTMNGPNEFLITGSMRDWSAIDSAKKIEVPTLLINGTNEGATDEAIEPFVTGVKEVKWVKLEKSTHMPMYEDGERYLQVISEFLIGVDK